LACGPNANIEPSFAKAPAGAAKEHRISNTEVNANIEPSYAKASADDAKGISNIEHRSEMRNANIEWGKDFGTGKMYISLLFYLLCNLSGFN